MRSHAICLLLAELFVSPTFGQRPADRSFDQVFTIAHAQTQQALQELVNAIQTIAGLRAAPDFSQRTLAVRGTKDQIELAGWLVNELDQPPHAPSDQPPTAHEYHLSSGGRDEVARVFFLAHVDSPQNLQRIINAIRGISEINRIMPDNEQRAIALRDTVEQVRFAEWLVGQLDQPADGRAGTSAALEFRLSGTGNEVARVFYTHGDGPQTVQEVINTIRTITGLPRIMPGIAPSALVVRGGADSVALAEWLVGELGPPAAGQTPDPAALAPHEFRLPGLSDGLTRVFYTHARSSQDLQQMVNSIRVATDLTRVMPFNSREALVVRGADTQVAAAEQLVQEMDHPKSTP